MKPEIEQAIAELRSCFGDTEVVAHAKENGNVIVMIDSIDVGPRYTPPQTWVKFEITFQYPYADIYPLFVRPDLVRADSQPHGKGIASASFEGKPALQLSRHNNHLNPEIDTATLKVTKVIQWLKER